MRNKPAKKILPAMTNYLDRINPLTTAPNAINRDKVVAAITALADKPFPCFIGFDGYGWLVADEPFPCFVGGTFDHIDEVTDFVIGSAGKGVDASLEHLAFLIDCKKVKNVFSIEDASSYHEDNLRRSSSKKSARDLYIASAVEDGEISKAMAKFVNWEEAIPAMYGRSLVDFTCSDGTAYLYSI